VFVSSARLCCVDMRKSGSSKKLDVSVPKPECLVGFESLGGGEGEGMSRGLWLKLRESARSVAAFPALLGGDDCIACNWRRGGSVVGGRVASVDVPRG
jgi:hypothetical protein